MKYSVFEIILLITFFQQIDPKSIRAWGKYGPRQGGWGRIPPWSGSGRLAGMMGGIGTSPFMGGNGLSPYVSQWNGWGQNDFWGQQQQLPVYQIFVPFDNMVPTNQQPPAPINSVAINPQVPQNSIASNTGPKLPIDCKYTDSTKSVLCTGFGQSVSCDASKMGNSTFTYFAISSMPNNGETPEDIRFPMYPLKADKSGFLDSMVLDTKTNQTTTYSLFFSPLITDSGLKIQQPTCWKQMMDTFIAGVRSTFEKNIESALITVNKEDGSSDSVIALASVSWA